MTSGAPRRFPCVGPSAGTDGTTAVLDPPDEPARSRRRPYRWAVVAAAVVAIALAGWAIASHLADRQERREARWQACAERVYPPEARSARVRELLEDGDDVTEADIERLGRVDQRGQRRIEAECGARP